MGTRGVRHSFNFYRPIITALKLLRGRPLFFFAFTGVMPFIFLITTCLLSFFYVYHEELVVAVVTKASCNIYCALIVISALASIIAFCLVNFAVFMRVILYAVQGRYLTLRKSVFTLHGVSTFLWVWFVTTFLLFFARYVAVDARAYTSNCLSIAYSNSFLSISAFLIYAYLYLRLNFSIWYSLDRKQGTSESLIASWHLTADHVVSLIKFFGLLAFLVSLIILPFGLLSFWALSTNLGIYSGALQTIILASDMAVLWYISTFILLSHASAYTMLATR